MSFHFDGNFRRLPAQALGGKYVDTDRQTLIKKAQLERKKREEIRRKEFACLKVQSFLR
jgi:ubiquitin-protein ligase E3 C